MVRRVEMSKHSLGNAPDSLGTQRRLQTCHYVCTVSELLDSMPANEKLPISKARLLRLFKDAQRVFSSAEMLGTRGSSGGWMSETDLSKKSLSIWSPRIPV